MNTNSNNNNSNNSSNNQWALTDKPAYDDRRRNGYTWDLEKEAQRTEYYAGYDRDGHFVCRYGGDMNQWRGLIAQDVMRNIRTAQARGEEITPQWWIEYAAELAQTALVHGATRTAAYAREHDCSAYHAAEIVINCSDIPPLQ